MRDISWQRHVSRDESHTCKSVRQVQPNRRQVVGSRSGGTCPPMPMESQCPVLPLISLSDHGHRRTPDFAEATTGRLFRRSLCHDPQALGRVCDITVELKTFHPVAQVGSFDNSPTHSEVGGGRKARIRSSHGNSSNNRDTRLSGGCLTIFARSPACHL